MLMDASKVRAPRFLKFGNLPDFETVVMDHDREDQVGEAIAASKASTHLVFADVYSGEHDVDSDVGRERARFSEV
jgi:hypothetical protein